MFFSSKSILKCYYIVFSIVINVFHRSVFHIFDAIDIAWGVVIVTGLTGIPVLKNIVPGMADTKDCF